MRLQKTNVALWIILAIHCAAIGTRLFAHNEIMLTNSNLSSDHLQALYILDLPAYDNTIFSASAIEGFEILQGKHTKKYSLLSRIDRTETIFGNLDLAHQLISPTTDISMLESKQRVIRELSENDLLFEQIETLVKHFKEVEPIFLSFWDYELNKNRKQINPFEEQTVNNLVKTLFYVLPKHIRKALVPTYLIHVADKTPWLLELLFYLTTTIEGATTLAGLALFGLPLYPAIEYLYNEIGEDTTLRERLATAGGLLVDGGNGENGENESFLSLANRMRKIGVNFLSMLTSIYSVNRFLKDTKELGNAILNTHNRLIQIARFLNETLVLTDQILKENRCLRKEIPELSAITKVVTNDYDKMDDFYNILTLLKTETFDGEPQSILSRKGRMLAVCNLLKKGKTGFIPLFRTIGILDRYLSLAKLYKDAQEGEAKYCFPTYVKADEPRICVEACWNPFLKREKAVTNSLEQSENGEGRCIIITGPNAGGKSTSMKTFSYNIILGQTCGIAPAARSIITPYNYIDSHHDIPDDIASGQSSYTADATQIFTILQRLEQLEPGEHAYLNIDEPLRTTNSRSAAAIVRAICYHIAHNIPNCACVMASHLTDVTCLEMDTDGIFKNYKVSVERTEEGISYPYKLEEGIADQSVAIDLLKPIGFRQEIIDHSKKLYKKDVSHCEPLEGH